jgi:hypothetical protein
MGRPKSFVFSELYLKHLEHLKIFDILITYQSVGYFKYVDVILIIYKQNLKKI